MISTGGHLTILESVDSTNNYAMAKVRTGLAKHGDGVFAMAQVAGKGQRGKAWITEPGTNIILTLVLRPLTLQLAQQFAFSTAIALAVYDFFAHYAGDETSIKWPNDIYWRDRKAGGILIENLIVSREASAVSCESSGVRPEALTGSDTPIKTSETVGEGLTTDASRFTTESVWNWAIVGMGININQTAFPENIRNAVSLKQVTGKHWDVIELAKELSSCVLQRYEQLVEGKDLLQQYNDHLFKKGQKVKLKKGSRAFEATVKEVNRTGELVVNTGIEEQFGFGEIEWLL